MIKWMIIAYLLLVLDKANAQHSKYVNIEDTFGCKVQKLIDSILKNNNENLSFDIDFYIDSTGKVVDINFYKVIGKNCKTKVLLKKIKSNVQKLHLIDEYVFFRDSWGYTYDRDVKLKIVSAMLTYKYRRVICNDKNEQIE